MNNWLFIALTLVAMNVVLLLFARRQQAAGQSIGRPVRMDLEWHGTYTQAFQHALDALGLSGALLMDADPYHGTILAGTGPSPRTYGSTVRIAMRTHDGITFVCLEAAPSASLIDLGASRAFVHRFADAWESNIPPPGSQPR